MDMEKAVICRIEDQEYALDIKNVISIERVPKLYRLPCTQEYMLGLMQFRGVTIPVIDLKLWLEINSVKLKGSGSKDEQRIVVVERDGNRVGLVVDETANVIDMRSMEIQKVDVEQHKDVANYVATSKDKIYIILDLQKLIHSLRMKGDIQ